MKPALSREDFARAIIFLEEALGVPLAPRRHEIYFQFLRDFDAVTLFRAARELVASRVYPTFPMIAEVRAAALHAHEAGELFAFEAWEIVLANKYRTFDDALSRIDNQSLREFILRFGRNNWREFHLAEVLFDERRRFEKAFETFTAIERARRLSAIARTSRAGVLSQPSAPSARIDRSHHGNS